MYIVDHCGSLCTLPLFADEQNQPLHLLPELPTPLKENGLIRLVQAGGRCNFHRENMQYSDTTSIMCMHASKNFDIYLHFI